MLEIQCVTRKIFFSAHHPFFFASDSKKPAIERFLGPGKISIDAIKFTSTVNSDTSIDFTIIPSSDDVVAIRGSLIDISVDDIKVSGEVDTISSGESSAGVGYNSTSSTSY